MTDGLTSLLRRPAPRLRWGGEILMGLAIVAASVVVAGGIYYWLGLPDLLKKPLGLAAFPLLLTLWFWPGGSQRRRRFGVLAVLLVFFVAYYSKEPVDRDWVPLHERKVYADVRGNEVTFHNFRDATHYVNDPVDVRWTSETFSLDELEGAQFIVQPFGDTPFTVHIFMSFRFSDGRRVAVSVEARRVDWNNFDPVAGFFRHFQSYLVVGTERDLVWKRLARDEPYTMYFYDVTENDVVIRRLFEGLIDYANSLAARPQYYSTLEESCFTGLVKLSPEISSEIGWWDIRRWIPGYAVHVLQGAGAVDDTLPAEALRERSRLRSGIRPPWEFESDAAWSAHIRGGPSSEENG